MTRHAIAICHGILTFDKGKDETWQTRMAAYFTERMENTRSYVFRYGPVLPLFSHRMTWAPYLSLPGIAREFYIGKLVRFLSNMNKEDPEREISVIAHSFGGWLLERAIPRLNFGIRTVIFLHCPISAHVENGYFYSYLEQGRIKKIVSWSSHEDEVIGRIALPPFGQNGYYGFIRMDHTEDRASPARQPYPFINLYNKHTEAEHSDVVSYEKYWPDLIEQVVKE